MRRLRRTALRQATTTADRPWDPPLRQEADSIQPVGPGLMVALTRAGTAGPAGATGWDFMQSQLRHRETG